VAEVIDLAGSVGQSAEAATQNFVCFRGICKTLSLSYLDTFSFSSFFHLFASKKFSSSFL